MSRVGLTYAESLFLACKEHDELDLVFEEFSKFIDILKNNKELESFLKNPIFSRDEKKELINNLQFKKSILFANYIKIMIDKRRESYYIDSYNEFSKLYFEDKKMVVIKVETAEPLNNEQKGKIKSIINEKFSKDAIIKEIVNKDLIMGIRIYVEGEEIDLSLKGSYDRLEQKLKNRIEVNG
ncbi:MAG: ATP synthase F1 subunit delta [Ezakiella sp.]|nr:ATP synthase F1 subunit delta [Ezakiella sp.]MDD7471856.1 ATP synthase F1 subunit delta [Bacillota bacterium]MDY3923820.1 ATP synthase F1 subunit delta [Ezakiella sp.]